MLVTSALNFIAENMVDFVGAGGVQEVKEYDVPLMKKMLRHYTDSLDMETTSGIGNLNQVITLDFYWFYDVILLYDSFIIITSLEA